MPKSWLRLYEFWCHPSGFLLVLMSVRTLRYSNISSIQLWKFLIYIPANHTRNTALVPVVLSFTYYLLHGIVKPGKPGVLMWCFRCRTAEFFILLQAGMESSGRKWTKWKFECSFLWSQMGVQLANCWMFLGPKAAYCGLIFICICRVEVYSRMSQA